MKTARGVVTTPSRSCLEVQRRALGGELHVRGDGSRDVIASLTTFACLAGAGCKPLPFSLLADDGVGRARRFVGDGV